MRIAYWNVNCGVEPGVVDTVRQLAEKFDVICLQEVHYLYHSNGIESGGLVRPTKGKTDQPHDLQLYSKLVHALRHTHVGHYTPHMRGMHDLEGSNALFDYGLATFFRFGMRPETVHTSTLHRRFGATNDGQPAARSIVSFTVRSPTQQRYLIGQSHFLWTPDGKVDTPERFAQSNRANAHLLHHRVTESAREELPVIFGGDLNLTSDTKAFQKLVACKVYGQHGAQVLNHTYGIADTRTALYTKNEREADFVLTSPQLNAELTVDYGVPSDHAALLVRVPE